MDFEKEKSILIEWMLAYEWRGKLGWEILDICKLLKGIGSLEVWRKSNWIQDPRCVWFHFSELILSSPFEIFIDYVHKGFYLWSTEMNIQQEQNKKFFPDGGVWLTLLITLAVSPEAPSSKWHSVQIFLIVLLILGPSLTTCKHLVTFELHRAYAIQNCKNIKTVSS